MELNRGDVVWVRLDPVEGSEQAGKRPAVVISPDIINEHSPVVIAAALTTKKTDRVYPFEVLIRPPEGGLTRKSKVLLLQIRAIDKRRILGKLGALSKDTMLRLDEALKIAVGLRKV